MTERAADLDTTGDSLAGLESASQYPLMSAILNRRSRRISKGLKQVPAGTLSYTSTQEPQPLTALEEALLIATTGATGISMHDVPFKTPSGRDIVSSWMHTTRGRAGSSADNVQSTHFIMINDSGTYLLKPPIEQEGDPYLLTRGGVTPDHLIEMAERTKVKILDHRLDFPREFPCYFSSNGYVSNMPGTTILAPIVDLSKQYINGLMQLLAQEDGSPRPQFIDDWYFFRSAGLKKWVKRGYLSKEQNLKLPLGLLGTMRIDVEAGLLLQNILLTVQAMGLGGWVHAAFYAPLLLGDPTFRKYGPGLGFRYEKPKRTLRRLLRIPITPLPAWRANPVGLDGILEGHTPPYYKNMDEAVDAVLAEKFGPDGVYTNASNFAGVYRPGVTEQFLSQVPRYSPEVVQCAKDICNYIWDTYGRFPAHVDAIYVPGVWIQTHHLDLEYYDKLFQQGYTETQANHQRLWHGA
ncbi:MAG: hypothetical protein WEB13_08985 [Dehalococcoidia bacterium]